MRSKIQISLLWVLLGIVIPVSAQEEYPGVKKYANGNTYDVAFNFSQGQFAGALSWSHLHGFGHKKQKFKIGYGIRFTSYVGANKFYTTAPSRLTSPVQNLGTIFSETLIENIDTIAIQTPQVNFINASIHIQYTIKRFDLGFNIDAIGLSFGAKKKINILSSQFDQGQAPVQEAKPTKFNLLLTSDNDLGSLNSEFYLRYWLSPQIGVRAGFDFLFTEYTSLNKHSFANGRIVNDRYRLKSSMILMGVSLKLSTKK